MKDKEFISITLPMGRIMKMDRFLMKHLRIAMNESNNQTGDLLRSIAVQLIKIDNIQLTNEAYDNLSIDDGIMINEIINSQMVRLKI